MAEDPVASAESSLVQRLVIDRRVDALAGQRAARALAASLGFADRACDEIALAALELAGNLAKYAPGGSLILRGLADEDRAGIEIATHDAGAGIASVELAMTDGFSTGGSLGTGLGTVNRLMDALEIASGPGAGTQVVCRRWLRAEPARRGRCPLSVGAASRPHPRMQVNGDAFVTRVWGSALLVGVIDGLGHGPEAFRAALAARVYVEGHYDQPLGAIFRGVGLCCRATRGVVMAIAVIDWGTRTLRFASLGNIEARVCGGDTKVRLMVRRGIVGLNAGNAAETTAPWSEGSVLVLHSDGVGSRWAWEDFAGAADTPALEIAQGLLRAQAKPEDDATVVVVKDECS